MHTPKPPKRNRFHAKKNHRKISKILIFFHLPEIPNNKPPTNVLLALFLLPTSVLPTVTHFIPKVTNKIPIKPKAIAQMIKARQVTKTSGKPMKNAS